MEFSLFMDALREVVVPLVVSSFPLIPLIASFPPAGALPAGTVGNIREAICAERCSLLVIVCHGFLHKHGAAKYTSNGNQLSVIQ